MKFLVPQQLSDGRFFVRTRTSEDKRVFVQLNKVKLLTQWAEGDDVTLHTEYDFTSLDNDILQAAQENSTTWFGREVQAKTIDAAYQRSSSSGTMNMPKSNKVQVFDVDKSTFDPNELDAETECDCVIELMGLVFMKKTFSCNWKIVQVRRKKVPQVSVYNTYLFASDSESEKSEDDDMNL